MTGKNSNPEFIKNSGNSSSFDTLTANSIIVNHDIVADSINTNTVVVNNTFTADNIHTNNIVASGNVTADSINTNNIVASNNITALGLSIGTVGMTTSGDIIADGHINASGLSIGSAGITTSGDIIADGNINASGLNIGSAGIQASGGLSTDGGLSYFNYSHGTWNPEFCFISGDTGKDYPLYSNPAPFVQNGYYVKLGRQVTVWFELHGDITNSYRLDLGTKYIGITGLPFIFNNADTPMKLSQKGDCIVGEWPNGIGADLAPAIGLPTYPKPYGFIGYEEGYDAPLFMYWGGPVDSGTWTADGYTIIMQGMTEIFTAALTAPPWEMIGSIYGPLSNFWFASLDPPHTCRFSGSFTYITNS